MPTRRGRLVVVVYGTPAPQGSKRHVGGGRMIESSKKVKPWRKAVQQAALEAMDEQPAWERDYPYIVVHAVFVLARPKFHFRSGKHAHLLRDNMPKLVGVKPDLDKLLRSTFDALTSAEAYVDDSRVVAVHARKAYVTNHPLAAAGMDRPGARIVLETYP